ncbi:uncharacterized protein Triagg1_6307 [Trichoderma aggressivum f. europaeum]|uniref:HMG box domain-containing protein n=1 Tax=Trichoderma aggressivum f. europaeum TaxID=173218 RepID=A0AAE1IBE5_9HYPO|nr:hypothetical protein Triagg1_6307 [Trichoderma aggressivum f. europaeum]
MTANATISGGTLHSYPPPAGGIKNEHDAHGFPSQLTEGYDTRIHSAVHNPEYGEGNRKAYVPFPVNYTSRFPISPPLSREGTRADTKDNLVAPSQYPSEVSPLDHSHMSGAMPSEGPNDDAFEEYFSDFSEPPSKKRKTKKKKGPPVLPEHLSHFKSTLSQLAEAKGYNHVLLEGAERYVARSTQVRLENDLKPDGTAKRTLNCFFLYRHTYHCVALTLIEKREQEASLICAVSWHRESQKFQEKFEKLAKKDSANQLLAFPDYKYAPSKSGTKGNKLVKDRASTKTGRVTRNRKPASKVKELRNFSEEVLQRAIDEQQSLPAEAVHPQPHWVSVAVEAYPAPCPVEYAVYPEPHLYHTQAHCIATYDDGYPQGRASSPVAIHGLYKDTENSDVNYNEGCIDPALLGLPSDVVASCQPGVVYNLNSYPVGIQRRSQPAPIERSRAETGILSWDYDEHALFLSGGKKDHCWEVAPLEAGDLVAWATHAEPQEV